MLKFKQRTNMIIKKTYVTKMPDKAGAFLLASQIISEQNGNIVRVNYNKSVDMHTLFIEVAATQEQHKIIDEKLSECGYLTTTNQHMRYLMIELTLDDVPGAVRPVLEVLNNYNVNISYINSQENGTPQQYFKMGLLIEDPAEIKNLIDDISKICEIKILDYEDTNEQLDVTIFYVTFANQMREILHLSQRRTNEVLVQANRLMQILDSQKKSPYTTFDYIRKFAKYVREKKGKNFDPIISKFDLPRDIKLYCIEPPCGSDTYILEHNDELLFVDTGFQCYRNEMIHVFNKLFDDFASMRKTAFITHADIDHVGLLEMMDKVYLSQNCYDNFVLQHEGKPDFREQIQQHAPYCYLSKIISSYTVPDLKIFSVIGSKEDEALFTYIGSHEFAGLNFSFYEGPGGHVKGETIIVCEELQMVFTGDIFINIKGQSDEQKEFNSLAPFLMTGVDCNPGLCKKAREALLKKYDKYLICPGHGPVMKIS